MDVSSYRIRNPQNTLIKNIAAGGEGHGFYFDKVNE
jgi:hypothetical protein